jgi:polysaccharide export outer membrane protein
MTVPEVPNRRGKMAGASDNVTRMERRHILLNRGRVLLAAALLVFSIHGSAQQAAPSASSATPDAGLDTPPQTTTAPVTPAAQGEPTLPHAGAAGNTTHGGIAGGMDNARYIIGSDDVLQITVWKEPTLSGTVPVRPDGMISMVLLGDIPATGTTPMQLGSNITERLKKYIQDPSVTVVVAAVNSQKIFLIGEVQHVGAISLSPGMSLLQAISAAGGLTNFANSKHLYILREVAGKQEKIPFNYKQALKGDSRQMLSLRPGDTIVVP